MLTLLSLAMIEYTIGVNGIKDVLYHMPQRIVARIPPIQIAKRTNKRRKGTQENYVDNESYDRK